MADLTKLQGRLLKEQISDGNKQDKTNKFSPININGKRGNWFGLDTLPPTIKIHPKRWIFILPLQVALTSIREDQG